MSTGKGKRFTNTKESLRLKTFMLISLTNLEVEV